MKKWWNAIPEDRQFLIVVGLATAVFALVGFLITACTVLAEPNVDAQRINADGEVESHYRGEDAGIWHPPHKRDWRD